MKQVLHSSTTDTTDLTRYLPLFSAGIQGPTGSVAVWQTDETSVSHPIPTSGTIRKLYVKLLTQPGSNASRTFTVMKNGTATNLQVTISNTSTSASDITNSVSVVAGDTLSLRHTASGSPLSMSRVDWSVEFEGSSSNENVLCSASADSPSTSVTEYNAVHCANSWLSTPETDVITLIPHSTTIKAFYIKLTVSPGAGKSYTFTIRKNGVDQTSSNVVISDTNTTGNVTGLNISLTAGDYITIKSVGSGLPNTTTVSWGVLLSSNTDGESIMAGVTGDNLGTTSTEYNAFCQSKRAWATTENDVKVSGGITSFTLKNFRIRLTTAPGSGKNRTFRVRKNETNGNSMVTISDTATTGVDSTNTDTISNGDGFDISQVANSSLVSSADASWCATQYIVVVITQSGSFTSNANFKKTASASFIANANLKKTVSNSFVANASFKKTIQQIFVADCNLKKTVQQTLTSDGNLLKTLANSFTADTSFKKVISDLFVADCSLAVNIQNSFVGYANLIKTINGSFTIDSNFKKTISQSFSADSNFRVIILGLFTANCNLHKVILETFTSNANFKKTLSEIFTADSNLVMIIANAFTGDSNLKKNVSNLFIGDTNLLKAVSSSLTSDASLLKVISAIFTGDAKLVSPSVTSSFAGYASLKKVILGDFLGDANLSKLILGDFIGHLNLQKTISSSFISDANFVKIVGSSFIAEGNLITTLEYTFTADISLKKVIESSFVSRCNLSKTITGIFLGDSNLLKTTVQSFSGNAKIGIASQVESFTGQANLRKTLTLVLVSDCNFKKTETHSLVTNASLKHRHQYIENIKKYKYNTIISPNRTKYNISTLKYIEKNNI